MPNFPLLLGLKNHADRTLVNLKKSTESEEVENWAILLGMLFEGIILNINMKKLALTVCAMGLASGAWAATDTSNLTVNATVENVCAIGSGALSFSTLKLALNSGAGTLAAGGNHDFDTGNTISVVCTNGATAAITAGSGSNVDGAVRRLKSGTTDFLGYELYTATGRVNVLNTTNSISYTGTGVASAVTVFGRVTAAQLALVKAGSYSDTVAMTVTYTP